MSGRHTKNSCKRVVNVNRNDKCLNGKKKMKYTLDSLANNNKKEEKKQKKKNCNKNL